MKKVQLDGKKIKGLRDSRERGSTQKEFAPEIGISERQLRNIENSNVPIGIDIAHQFARALNKPLEELLIRVRRFVR